MPLRSMAPVCMVLFTSCMVSVSRPIEPRGEMRPTPRAPADSVASAREREMAALLTGDPGQRRPRLTWNPILARVARERARDMAARGYFAHVTPEGVGPNTLVERAGYVLPAAYDHALGGNNIESAAEGYASAADAWRRWMGSPRHRSHLLGIEAEQRKQSEFGIGFAVRPGRRAYWVVLIAEPGTSHDSATSPPSRAP